MCNRDTGGPFQEAGLVGNSECVEPHFWNRPQNRFCVKLICDYLYLLIGLHLKSHMTSVSLDFDMIRVYDYTQYFMFLIL